MFSASPLSEDTISQLQKQNMNEHEDKQENNHKLNMLKPLIKKQLKNLIYGHETEPLKRVYGTNRDQNSEMGH